MASPEYQSLLPHRVAMGYPENTKPEYTILTHAKIDFLSHVIDQNISNSKFLVWLDFGYLSPRAMSNSKPNASLDTAKMSEGMVTICCLNGGLSMQDADIIYTLKNAPEKLAGGLFLGDRASLKQFQQICHEWLIRYQSMNIADDEQAMWIQCIFQNPSLFYLHVFSGWHDSLKYFTRASV